MVEQTIITDYNHLSLIERRLLDAAESARERALPIFSHFYVGAAVLTVDGAIFGGANIECSSYGLTLCAERAAIAHAVSEGYKLYKQIAIITRQEESATEHPSWSCGACRQWLYDFSQLSGADIEIITSNTDKSIVWKNTIGNLLHEAFGPADLGVNVADLVKD